MDQIPLYPLRFEPIYQYRLAGSLRSLLRDGRHARPILVSSSGADFMGRRGGTQIVATLIAVYGLFMTPLGWGWALI